MDRLIIAWGWDKNCLWETGTKTGQKTHFGRQTSFIGTLLGHYWDMSYSYWDMSQ